MKYICLRCGFDAKQKITLERHLNRKNICEAILEPMSIIEVKKYYSFEKREKNDPKLTPSDPKMTPNDPKMTPTEIQKLTPNDPKIFQSDPKMTPKWGHFEKEKSNSIKNKKQYQCEHCSKFYSKNCHLRRHEKVCIKKKMFEFVNANETEVLKKEIKELKATMKSLLTISDNNTTNNTNCNNTNNTNCNNTNNITNNTININNYGSENKDYITKEYLIKLLKAPFQAIPKLIEYTHFNKDHPENQNIKLPNKKEPYVKVLKDDKWVYMDRKSTILDLIDEKHCELNDGPLIKHIEDKFSEHLQDRFERFNDRYLNDEKEFTKQLYKETELVMINNR